MRYAINLWHQAVVARGIRGGGRKKKNRIIIIADKQVILRVWRRLSLCAVWRVWFSLDRFVARLKLIYRPFKDERVRLSFVFVVVGFKLVSRFAAVHQLTIMDWSNGIGSSHSQSQVAGSVGQSSQMNHRAKFWAQQSHSNCYSFVSFWSESQIHLPFQLHKHTRTHTQRHSRAHRACFPFFLYTI